MDKSLVSFFIGPRCIWYYRICYVYKTEEETTYEGRKINLTGGRKVTKHDIQ